MAHEGKAAVAVVAIFGALGAWAILASHKAAATAPPGTLINPPPPQPGPGGPPPGPPGPCPECYARGLPCGPVPGLCGQGPQGGCICQDPTLPCFPAPQPPATCPTGYVYVQGCCIYPVRNPPVAT